MTLSLKTASSLTAALGCAALVSLPQQALALNVIINSVQVNANCELTVTGSVQYTRKVPATAVTFDYLPPNQGAEIRLATIPLQANGAYQWVGMIPGYSAIPSGGRVKVVTNRQVNRKAYVSACTPPTAQTMLNFASLTNSGIYTSYSQAGYTVTPAVNGAACPSHQECLLGSSFGLANNAKGAYILGNSPSFSLTRDSGNFRLKSLVLRNTSPTIGAQSVIFTGHLASGGTVTYTATTYAQTLDYKTFDFPDNFTGLTSVTWPTAQTVVADIVLE